MRKSQSTEFWQGHIAACDKSDLNQTNYCAKHNIALSTFGYWKKKIRKQVSNNQVFYPLAIPAEKSSIPVQEVGSIRILLGDARFSVEVDKGFSTTTLLQVITTLEQL